MFDEQYNYIIEDTVSGVEVTGYYTKDEVDTVSGTLQINIDAKPDTFLELNDTPSVYDNSKYLQSTAAGTFWAYIAGIAGPKGEDGGEWLSGYGAPSTVTGTLNNFYLDFNNGDIYRKEPTVTGTAQYGVMLAREASGSYVFADAVRFVKTGHEVIVDDIDDEASFTGSWYPYNTGNAWGNSCKYTTTDYTAQVNFRFIVPENGEYDVYAYWPALSAACPDAPYLITHASGTNTVRKDQRTNGSTWNYLSTHRFDGAAAWVWKMNIQGSTTFSGLSDTPAMYDNGKYLRATAAGTEWYDLNDDYYTELEVDTISGSLHSEIYSHTSSTSNPHSVTLEQARIVGNIISSNNSIKFRDSDSMIYSSTANELTLNATNEVVVERDLHIDRDLYVDHRFTINGGTSVEIIRDEDDFGHDDSHALITQQSAKAYVDAHTSSTSNPHSVTLEQARIAGNTVSSNNAINFRDGNSIIYSSTANELTLSATNEVVVERDLHVDRDLYVGNRFTINGGVSVNIIRDEDDMGHDDSTALITQQSAKAYVDAHTTDTSIHFDQFTELSDTPNSYDDEKHLVSTTSGLDWTSSVTVVGGDVYFVDTTRSNKKLGVSMIDIGCGRNSAATTNQYLRTYNGTLMNQAGIPLLFNATLVGISMSEYVNTQSWYARVRRNDSTTNVYSHQLVNAYEVHSFTVNVDFSEGDRIQIYLEGTSIDYPQVRTYWRRRF